MNRTEMMRRISQLAFAMFAAAGVSCAHRSVEPLPSNPEKQFASTQPAVPENGSPRRAVTRLTGWRWVLAGWQHQYLLKEGPAHRGANFAKLVNALAGVAQSERPVTEIEVIELLGWPDYEKFDQHGGAYAYIYSDRQRGDMIAGVQVDATGTVILVNTFLKRNTDLHLFHQYKPWPEGRFPGFEERYQPQPGSGFLGIQLDDTHAAGLTIHAVVPDSPAAVAGLEAGDVILDMDKKAVVDEEPLDFVRHVADLHPRHEVVMRVRRANRGSGSREFDLTLTVGSRPASTSK